MLSSERALDLEKYILTGAEIGSVASFFTCESQNVRKGSPTSDRYASIVETFLHRSFLSVLVKVWPAG